VERRVADPIIDFKLFHNRIFVSANGSLILCYLAIFAVSFILPFYLEELHGFSIIEAGLLLTPLPLTIALIAPFSGALADKIGSRWLAASGLTVVCIGLFLISQLDAHSSINDIIWRLMLTGAGQALFQSPNSSALMGSVARSRQGSASGFLSTGRVMGQSVSVALTGAIFTGLGGAFAGTTLIHPQSMSLAAYTVLQNTFTMAFHTTFLVCTGIAACSIVAAFIRGKERMHD
ncbi:MAG: MFS transporter, partial [Ktedonobacteraceae bacterium]